MSKPHILIAGAGIGGLAASLALARDGIHVSLFERAAALDEAGAGIQLSPNATRILAGLGVLDEVSASAFTPTGIRVRSARSARQIVFMPLKDADLRWGAPYIVAHRADLQRALVAAVLREPGVTLSLDTTLAGFGTTPTGIVATIKQGLLKRTIEGNALIGADGIRSIVRARLVADAATDLPTETGRLAWRALIPADAVPSIFSAPETGLWLGSNAHLVHYPLRGERLVNVVAITRETKSDHTEQTWSRPGDPTLIARRFGGWHASVQDLIAASPTWQTWPLFDREPLPAWSAGPIALLGDAAHPILPFLAQGAGQAIEDAAALADAISCTRGMADALSAYSRSRQTRATRVQVTSRTLGKIYHLAGPMALARDTTMRLLGGPRLLARYDWLYGA